MPVAARDFLEAVNRGDVGMIERGQDFGLALQASDAIGILREGGGQDLDRDVALQARVAGTIDLAHSAGADHRLDFVRTEARSALEGTVRDSTQLHLGVLGHWELGRWFGSWELFLMRQQPWPVEDDRQRRGRGG
jgi:hypothetical protein